MLTERFMFTFWIDTLKAIGTHKEVRNWSVELHENQQEVSLCLIWHCRYITKITGSSAPVHRRRFRPEFCSARLAIQTRGTLRLLSKAFKYFERTDSKPRVLYRSHLKVCGRVIKRKYSGASWAMREHTRASSQRTILEKRTVCHTNYLKKGWLKSEKKKS